MSADARKEVAPSSSSPTSAPPPFKPALKLNLDAERPECARPVPGKALSDPGLIAWSGGNGAHHPDRIRILPQGESSQPNSSQLTLNQRCRSEIIHRINEEEGGKRLRNLGWGEAESRERLSREIKRNLFKSPDEIDQRTESELGKLPQIRELDEDWNQLETAIYRISQKEAGAQITNSKGIESARRGGGRHLDTHFVVRSKTSLGTRGGLVGVDSGAGYPSPPYLGV